MATIYDFARQLADTGDWTHSERAQLRELAGQLGRLRIDLDIVFGRSDDGDPWCVVTDSFGDVQLHVARIGGLFVVHSTDDDEIVEGKDLWGAALQLLGDMLKDRRGVLLPFSAGGLTTNAILAFMLAAALRGELDHLGDVTRIIDAAKSHGEETASSASHPGETFHGQHGTETTAQATPLPADGPIAGPSTALPTYPAPAETGDLAAALALAEAHESGASAAAALSAAGHPGATQVVLGGPTDNRIQMGEHVLAVGGDGADTFVLNLPTTPARDGPARLGVVLDFHAQEGDRLAFSGDAKAVKVSDRPVADPHAEAGGPPVPGDLGALAVRHVGYDLNGDKVEDAYVLVVNGAHDWAQSAAEKVKSAGTDDSRAAAENHTSSATSLFTNKDAPEPPSLAIGHHDMTF